MKRPTILVRVLAAMLASSTITSVLPGWLIEQAGAQTVLTPVRVVRVCAVGSLACTDFTGRRLIITRSLGGVRDIPAGCALISPIGDVFLPNNDAIVVHAGDAAIMLMVNPDYPNPSPGDRIDIVADTRQCCLNGSGDLVVACTGASDQPSVREIDGVLH